MVHGLRIEGGKALWYRNRWVRGAEACAKLGEPIPPGPRAEGFDAPNTNVFRLAGPAFPIVEARRQPAELSATLDTLAHNPSAGPLAVPYTATPPPPPSPNDKSQARHI